MPTAPSAELLAIKALGKQLADSVDQIQRQIHGGFERIANKIDHWGMIKMKLHYQSSIFDELDFLDNAVTFYFKSKSTIDLENLKKQCSKTDPYEIISKIYGRVAHPDVSNRAGFLNIIEDSYFGKNSRIILKQYSGILTDTMKSLFFISICNNLINHSPSKWEYSSKFLKFC